MKRRSERRRSLALVALSALVAALGACSDGDSSEGSATTVVSSSAGTADPPAGEPVRIGFVNLEGGVVSLPEIRVGAEVAVEHINADLGGVQGRPVELVTCELDLTPEKSIDCANQLVEADVAMVVLGIDVSIDAALPIYEAAGIPLVGNAPFTPAALESETATFLGASLYASAAAPLQHFADAGADSVTYLLGESAVTRDLAESTLEPFAEELGIEYRTVFYDQAAPDWSVVTATAMADDPDVIGSPAAPDPDCTGFIGALASAGYGGDILAGQCIAFVEELGDQAVGALTTTNRWLPSDVEAAPADKQEEIGTYISEMTEAGAEDRVDSFGVGWFAITMDVFGVLRSIEGSIDRATIREALRNVVDQPSYMGGEISCDGSVAPGQSVCTAGVLLYEVDESGDLKAASDDFVDVGGLLDG